MVFRENKGLFVADIVCGIFFLVCILVISMQIWRDLKIKLNFYVQLGFILNFIALIIRLVINIVSYNDGKYDNNAAKQYLYWAVDSIFFLFYLNNFSRVLLSWLLTKKLKQTNSNQLITTPSDFNHELYQQVQDEVVKLLSKLDQHIRIYMLIYLCLSLPITIIA